MINYSYAFAETLDVLQNMDEMYVKQIPQKFIDMLNKNASKSYVKHINPNVDIKEQNLSKETINILAVINLKYWVKDKEYKERLLKKYMENEEKFNRNLNTNIQLNDLFIDKNKQFDNNEKQTSLIKVEKLNFFQRLLKKIKNLFQ